MSVALQRWTARRLGLLVVTLVVVVLLGGSVLSSLFDNDVAVKTWLRVGALGCPNLEPQWLQAQAVPSASQVPCVRSLPAGWSLNGVAVNDGRAVFVFDSDRAGSHALVADLTAGCDPAGAAEVPSPTPGVRRFIEEGPVGSRVSWYDRFPGGCVTYQLTAPGGLQGSFSDQEWPVFGFTPRQVLRQALAARSDGRLHLDQGEAG